MTEAALQRHVETAAKQLGWLVYHTWNSMKSEPGFPDLVMLRGGRMIVAELKRDGKDPRPEQWRWLDHFSAVAGVEDYVWRPADWESGEIVRVLTRSDGRR